MKRIDMGRRAPLFLALALLVIATLAYWPGLSGGFIFDDYSTFVENTRVHATSLDAGQLQRAAWSFDPGGAVGKRPLAMASFAVNHVLHGLDPWGYKLGGLLIHLLNTVLVFVLVQRILTLPAVGMGSRSWLASAAITLAWAVHPLQVSTVLYVVQRMETLSFTFVLLALACYVQGRRQQLDGRRGWPWLLACLPLLGLGMAAKESAVLLPGFMLALELTVLGFAARNTATARGWRWAYGLAFVLAVLAYAFLVVPHYWRAEIFGRHFNTAERLYSQLQILPMYLGQMLLPLSKNLPFFYDQLQPSKGLLSPPATLAGGVLLAALLGSALWLRRKAPLYALGILWFFVAHVLTSNVIALELAFEHRNYFALLGIVLAVADGVRRIRLRDGPALKYVAVAAVLLSLTSLTVIRSAIWGDPLLLATEHVTINPGSARAANNLATLYFEMADGHPNSPFNDFAMREFERAASIPGSSIVSDQGLILTATHGGHDVEDAWWQRLRDKLTHQPITPETSGAMFGLLGNRMKGAAIDDDQLIDTFLAFFDRATLPAYSYAQFGDYVLTKAGDQDLADQAFAKAIERSANHPDYARQVVNALIEQGHQRQARAALAQAHGMGMLEDLSASTTNSDP